MGIRELLGILGAILGVSGGIRGVGVSVVYWGLEQSIYSGSRRVHGASGGTGGLLVVYGPFWGCQGASGVYLGAGRDWVLRGHNGCRAHWVLLGVSGVVGGVLEVASGLGA